MFKEKVMVEVIFAIAFLSFLVFSDASPASMIGVNYGRLGNNLPSPYESIELLKTMKAGRVKLYDANPEILRLLSGTNLHVSIMVPNEQISAVAANQSAANRWVRDNVLSYYPNTMIRYILVGNEVLSNKDDQSLWYAIVPAMRNIKKSIDEHNIHNIKIGTPLAMDILQTSFPPSSGEFRVLQYPVAIAETGWPNGGDYDEIGANTYNAATYNRNLIRRITSQPPIGTPARPGSAIPTFIFSLYDENQKGVLGTERHWGLLHPNGRPIYDIDLTGQIPEAEFSKLPQPNNNGPFHGKLWRNGTCDEIAPGKSCYQPVSIVSHANYAFSSYWAKFRKDGETCHFNELAVQSTIDPSHGSCKFPYVSL
ncbi:hypothetical protein RND71_004835 [Anisodus tanguticus]|uniref:X8 domain-containing protein n=1 Tax=Anisodus tanguticus TaxID=243964 RepID=A0AAE1SMU6_9SOLA|nr:hypothetical protein RND71_004835 [Anisodus tanguticus]